MTPLDCAHVGSDGSCTLAENPSLRLHVGVESGCRVTVYQGGGLGWLPTIEAGPDGGLLAIANPAPGSRLYVAARCGLRFVFASVLLRPASRPQWLRESEKLWDDNHNAQAEELLRRHLSDATSPAERSEALGRLARLTREAGHLTAAEALFRQALAEDRAAGRPSDEANDTFALASMLAQNLGLPRAAEALLREHAAAVAQVPSMQPWHLLNQALYRQMQGDLSAALPLVDEGLRLALRYGDVQAQRSLHSLQAQLLEMVGRLEETEQELQEDAERTSEPCLKANAYSTWGLMRLRRWEAHWPDPPDLRLDPRPQLREAERLRVSACTQEGEIAADRTALARAFWLAGALDESRRWLTLAQRLPESQSETSLTLEWQELTAALALDGGNPAEAVRGYARLLQELPTLGSGSRSVGLIEQRYRAQIGLARSLEKDDAAAALAAYQAADEFLEKWGIDVPGWGRGGFLGRHEGGTRLYISLLARTHPAAEAFALFRRVRTRALRALWQTARLESLSPAEGQALESSMVQYRKLRAELEQLPLASELPLSEMSAVKLRQQRLREQMTEALERVLASLGVAAPADFAAPASQEGLLGCHPAKVGWLCFLADASSVQLRQVDRLDATMPASALAEALLVPFSSTLDHLRRLKVLGYGEMRDVDVHALPLHGRALGTQVEVLYSLDLPIAATNRSGWTAVRGHATIFLGQVHMTLSDEERLRQSAVSVSSALQRWGWKVNRSFVQDNPTGLAPEASDRAQALRKALGGAELFHYIGHGQQSHVEGLAALLPALDQPVSAQELLGMDEVPRYVILFGCQTGRNQEPSGGLQGLGVAQAFLLRGSQWVIAAERRIPIDRLPALSAALQANDVAAEPNPSAIVARLTNIEPAFRVYVP